MEKVIRPQLQMVSAKQIVREYVKAGKQGWLTVVQDRNSNQTELLATTQATEQTHNLQDAKQLQHGLTTLLSEFADMFKPPGSPHPRELKH